jgi:iron complex transport system ATP-binding protein
MSLHAEALGLRRGGRTLLESIHLDLKPGELHAILGPNGAGKSSLLRCLGGELRPTTGQVRLDQRDLGEWTPLTLARRRAVLPQGESLRFPFPVAEVVRLGRLPLPALPAAAEQARIEAALRTTGCSHLLARAYTDLSGGERQRVQLARVLIQVADDLGEGARYLILDEPTSALDLAHQHELLQALRQRADAGLGVVMSLHDPNLALAYADRVTLLCCGLAVAQGTPAAVLTPAALARYFGVRAEVVARGDGRIQLLMGGRL